MCTDGKHREREAQVLITKAIGDAYTALSFDLTNISHKLFKDLNKLHKECIIETLRSEKVRLKFVNKEKTNG